jgi:probable HAF family extracellular repeat protein
MRTRTALSACLLVTTCLVATCLLTAPAPAVTTYTITDLGTLGGEQSVAYDINDAGQVVGQAYIGAGGGHSWYHAFLWENGVMTDLGTLEGGEHDVSVAYGINQAGEVVGMTHYAGGYRRAFLWVPEPAHGLPTGMNNLGTLGGSYSLAYGVNDLGQVVGLSETGAVQGHAFLWDEGSMTDLSVLLGSSGYDEAFDINNSGQVVGRAGSPSRAFVWDSDSGVTWIANGSDVGTATAINEVGQVVGIGEYAFLWDDGVLTDLGKLDGLYTEALGLNDVGQIVGAAGNSAVLWDNGLIYDLDDLIPSGSGWQLHQAFAVNNSGLIVGRGTNPSGYDHAFLLTPIPEPGTFLLAALGMLALALVKKIRG